MWIRLLFQLCFTKYSIANAIAVIKAIVIAIAIVIIIIKVIIEVVKPSVIVLFRFVKAIITISNFIISIKPTIPVKQFKALFNKLISVAQSN